MSFLAGDLGGTKTLLGIYNWDNGLKKLYQKRYESKSWKSFNQIIIDFIDNLPRDIAPPKHGCIAVAGQVINNQSKITNLEWELNSQDICNLITLEKLELINDFSVLLYGLNYLHSNQYISIQNVEKESTLLSNGLIAIIGAGTGLGISRGLKTPKGIKVLPSEGGHKEFSPRSDKEWLATKWLKEDLGLERISLERIVSGNGLGNLARWRLMQDDAKSHPLRNLAEELGNKSSKSIDMPSIASKAATQGDPLMIEVLDLWLGAYGSAAGDLALQELCYGGLWIGGGTALKHIQGIRSMTFLRSFKNKGRFKPFLESIPVKCLIDPEIGMFSAGCRAHLLANEMGDLLE